VLFEIIGVEDYNVLIVQLVIGDEVMAKLAGSRGRRIVAMEMSRTAQINEARATQGRLPGYNDMKHDNYANYVDSIYTRYSDGK